MSATSLGIVFLATLIVFDVVVPLGLGAMAARTNARYRSSRGREGAFWGMTGGYVVLAAAIGAGLIDTVAHTQKHDFAAFAAAFVLSGFTLPGSTVPVLLTFGLSIDTLPRPAGISSLTVWLVIGVLCWSFFDVAGLRWLLQIRRRSRIRSGQQSMT